MASAILVTPSRSLAEAVRAELLSMLVGHPRGEIARESLSRYGLALVVKDLDDGLRVADSVAPEHLEIICKDAVRLSKKVRHAGAVFTGPFAPEALGDYAAGPSHTLPTGGTARFMSGLSPLSFMKRTSLVGATRQGLFGELAGIEALAAADGLPAHAASAKRRFAPRGRPSPPSAKARRAGR